MQIGAQAIEIVLETGTSATVLFTGYAHNAGINYYEPGHSPSYRNAGQSTCGWKMPSLPYAESRGWPNGNTTIDVKGTWVTDEVAIGEGARVVSVTPFILTPLPDDLSKKFIAGGALGLALGIDGSKSAIQRILSGVEFKQVTLWLENGGNSSDERNGAITFGGSDPLLCDTEWVETSGDWTVPLSGLAVGPTPLLTSPRQQVVVSASVSVSTLFLELPFDVYDDFIWTLRYFANITDSGTTGIVLIDCADVPSLPPITLQMGDVHVVVTGEDYTIASKENPNTCVILIKPAPATAWTLGLPFLPKGCISYDYENAVLGFAKPATK
ncbi:renin isoform 1 [Aphelenchoides avenae]|nr:renin isoform 1 [Aphelenchus avenae]